MAAIQSFTVTIHEDGSVTLRATDAAQDGQAWAVERREVSYPALRKVAAALGITAEVDRGMRMVIDRLDRIASAEEAALERARAARVIVDELRSRVDGPSAAQALQEVAGVLEETAETGQRPQRYCGGGMTDVGSRHAPHAWAQDPLGRWCPGEPGT